ncbi:MAG: DoxX family membrane protein, partial [Patescibacteria group bacterium]
MTQFQKVSFFLLRVTVGWMMFYAGIIKVIDPTWSAAGYLKGAKMFTGFYQWFLTPGMLPVINFVNEWGLTMLGLSLIFGVFVRLSSFLGVILMFLYY